MGWDQTPEEAMKPAQVTPLRGLYLMGQWTYPQGGSARGSSIRLDHGQPDRTWQNLRTRVTLLLLQGEFLSKVVEIPSSIFPISSLSQPFQALFPAVKYRP